MPPKNGFQIFGFNFLTSSNNEFPMNFLLKLHQSSEITITEAAGSLGYPGSTVLKVNGGTLRYELEQKFSKQSLPEH